MACGGQLSVVLSGVGRVIALLLCHSARMSGNVWAVVEVCRLTRSLLVGCEPKTKGGACLLLGHDCQACLVGEALPELSPRLGPPVFGLTRLIFVWQPAGLPGVRRPWYPSPPKKECEGLRMGLTICTMRVLRHVWPSGPVSRSGAPASASLAARQLGCMIVLDVLHACHSWLIVGLCALHTASGSDLPIRPTQPCKFMRLGCQLACWVDLYRCTGDMSSCGNLGDQCLVFLKRVCKTQQ
jgi:hypothetical protein